MRDTKLRMWAVKILALAVMVAIYGLTLLPELSTVEAERLSSDFSFGRIKLFEPADAMGKTVREVHPQYERISAWISAVGASVAFADIDMDLKFNDIVHVDPRFDKVWIETAPGIDGSGRYLPITLDPSPLYYDLNTMAPMGVLTNDFNEDGQTDVLVYYWGRTPIIYYQDHLSFRPVDLTSNSLRWFSNAATLADFDGDGQTDILITNYFPDGAKVLDAAAKDKNQTMQYSMSRAFNGGTDHLFLRKGNDGDNAAFIEAKGWMDGIEHPQDWTLAVGASDLNGDGLPEVYFANDFGPDKLLLNISKPGKVRFQQLKARGGLKTIPSSVLGKDSFKGMGVDFGDINNDGALDIYVSNIADEYALEESHFAFISTNDWEKASLGEAPFVNESEKLGLSRSSWGWDSKLADFNNDGQVEAIQATGFVKGEVNRWPELQELAIGNDDILATPEAWPDFGPGTDLSGNEHNPFFVRSQSGRFYDLAATIGIGEPMVTRGIAIADADGDGDLDFAAANQWESSFLYKNNYSGDNSFIGLSLVFPIDENSITSTQLDPAALPKFRYAIGAQVKIKLPDGKLKTAFVDGGNGHSGKNGQHVFFGLGNNNKNLIDVEIHWVNKEGEKKTSIIKVSPGWHTILLPYNNQNGLQ